ncbi:MAG TPA: hypothetical protein VHT53_06100 [Candidatus Elarobacter sp.]|jgi:hypothetical protein|nr:hypothetical protein [Candidatus Elarobacter sp.]
MYDANLADVYQPIYERILALVAEGVADPGEIATDLTMDGSPIWHYANRTVKLEPLSGNQVRITNGLSSYRAQQVTLPIEPVGPVVAQIISFLGAKPEYD